MDFYISICAVKKDLKDTRFLYILLSISLFLRVLFSQKVWFYQRDKSASIYLIKAGKKRIFYFIFQQLMLFKKNIHMPKKVLDFSYNLKFFKYFFDFQKKKIKTSFTFHSTAHQKKLVSN